MDKPKYLPRPNGVDPPKGIVQVPEIAGCHGCYYYWHGGGCARNYTSKISCYDSSTIFVEDTPEARAAYVAWRLES